MFRSLNYTKIMYDAAHAAYEQNGEVHPYTGLLRGLGAVVQSLCPNLDWKYFSYYHHDPLASIANLFAPETATFEDVVKAWDAIWFGLGTGRFRELSYPFNEPQRVYLTGRHHALDLTWIKNEVSAALKKSKIRRGTKRHDTFVQENARKVVEAASRAARSSAASTTKDLQQSRAHVAELAAKAHDSLEKLEQDFNLRRSLLEAAQLTGSPVVDDEFNRMRYAWMQAVRELDSKVEYADSLLARLADDNLCTISAVETMSRDDVLSPFTKALGLTT